MPARTRASTMTRNRITLLTMLLIITRALAGKFQLVFGVDKKTAEADDLVPVLESTLYSRVELALNSGLDFNRYVLTAFLLNVNDVPCSFLDDGLVGYRKEFSSDRNDLDHVVQAVGMPNTGQSRFYADPAFHGGDLCYPRLKH